MNRISPYPGLRPFSEEEAIFSEVEKIIFLKLFNL